MPEEGYLPHSSFRRFPDQVKLLPASPSPPSSRNGRSKSGYQRPPSASLSEQLREDPIPSETRAARETGSPSCFFIHRFSLEKLSNALVAFDGPRDTLGQRHSAASREGDFPQQARARAHSCPARGSLGPQGKEGAARAPPTTQAEPEPPGPQKV